MVVYPAAQDSVLVPRLLVSSAFLFCLVFVLLKKNLFPGTTFWKTLLPGLTTVYFLVVLLSSFFAVNFKEALFDISKTFVFLVIFIFSSQFLAGNTFSLRKLPLFFLISTFFMLVIGYNQYFSLVHNSQVEFLPDGLPVVYRVKGLMAHKNLFSSALFLSLPFIVWGIFTFKGRVQMLFALVAAGTFILLILLSTRAVWLGLIVSLAFVVIFLLLAGQRFGVSAKFRIALLVAGLLFFAGSTFYIYRAESSSDFSVAARLRSIFDPEASNNRFRLNVWEASLQVWKENPALGVGPGNWKIKVQPVFKNYNFSKEQLNWNRPHNDFLWVLAEKGLIGLIAFLGMFAVAFVYLLRVTGKAVDKQTKILAFLLAGGLLGYAVISFFDFPLERIYHQSVLAVWLSVAVVLNVKPQDKKAEQRNSLLWVFTFLPGLLFIFIYSFSSLRLETTVEKAVEAQQRGHWELMLNRANTIPTALRNIDAVGMPVYYYRGLAAEKLKNYNAAQLDYLQALKDHPAKVQVMNNLGLMFFYQNDLESARKYFEMALAILPGYFEALANLSAVCDEEGKYRESLGYLQSIPKERWDERFYEKERILKQLIDRNNQ
jgi:O-antigen ligase